MRDAIDAERLARLTRRLVNCRNASRTSCQVVDEEIVRVMAHAVPKVVECHAAFAVAFKPAVV